MKLLCAGGLIKYAKAWNIVCRWMLRLTAVECVVPFRRPAVFFRRNSWARKISCHPRSPRARDRGHPHRGLEKGPGPPAASNEPETRYSPAKCIGCDMKTVSGVPDPAHVSTSFVERQNLTMRMSMRRFTRLTNAFSKKVENHAAAVALHFIHYNFARVHKTLRITPAMAAGISDHVWTLEEIAGLAQ